MIPILADLPGKAPTKQLTEGRDLRAENKYP